MPPSADFQDFLNHLTENALASLRNADEVARSNGSSYVGTEHLLLGVLAQKSSIGAKMLDNAGVTMSKASVALNSSPHQVTHPTGAKGLSEVAKLTLRMAYEISQDFHQDYCGTEHILYSILSQKNARACEMLRSMDVDIDPLLSELEQFLSKRQGGRCRLNQEAEKNQKNRA